MFREKTLILPDKDQALPGRETPIALENRHYVNGRPIFGAMPEGIELAAFGLGCFWGAERLFWQLEGVFSTAVGYAGGHTPNPSYEEVCSGLTAHTEVVAVYFDPSRISYAALLQVFWEAHNPTQGMRQGNDIGTQYRSAIYTTSPEQLETARRSKQQYQALLSQRDLGEISSEIEPLQALYLAEAYHQQYLAKNPNGYCGLQGLGVVCPSLD